MTIERPMFPPRRDNPFRVVGGIDFTPLPEPMPAQSKRERRGRARTAWHTDGLPVIDPAGEQDHIFRHIAEHRAAIAHYDHCVTVENDAEGKVSADEHFYIQQNTSAAFDRLMLWARCVIASHPTTRRGLIHQARYLAAQFSEHVGRDAGACQNIYLPTQINDRPWVATFLRSLAAGLRKMSGEFPDSPPKRSGVGYAIRTEMEEARLGMHIAKSGPCFWKAVSASEGLLRGL
jgi:hypothetical protein